jgi:hypothetical protein
MNESLIGKNSVPRYEAKVFRKKATRYCLVIPVINEGPRIQAQLHRMKGAGIDRLVDTIIADGGSTDGSLNEIFLRDMGVRALLTKRDTGKLSAQLRMGYAFALEQNYDGVITIDGNNKDSVESIPLFINALDEGVDYAQASRFIKGGSAINTPFVRHLAIKLIHAPLLSLAAGRRFSDTTQGFRGYSRRYLEHPQVQPFRNVFHSYELLAYLTVRASQLGLKTREIPTTRAYPADGKIPTKINAHGTSELLKILARTVLGKYNP